MNRMISHSHLEDWEINWHKVPSKGFPNKTSFELRRGCWMGRKEKGGAFWKRESWGGTWLSGSKGEHQSPSRWCYRETDGQGPDFLGHWRPGEECDFNPSMMRRHCGVFKQAKEVILFLPYKDGPGILVEWGAHGWAREEAESASGGSCCLPGEVGGAPGWTELKSHLDSKRADLQREGRLWGWGQWTSVTSGFGLTTRVFSYGCNKILQGS